MALNGLMLHCGGEQTDWDQIELCPTPDPIDRWHPVPHAELVREVQHSLTDSGMEIVNQQHGLSHRGARYFGLMHVANGDNSNDYGTLIGIRNSHDKSFSAGLSIGAGVFVCDNMSFSGEVVLARKHTRQIRRDLPRLVNTCMAKLTDARKRQDMRFDEYKQHEIDDKFADHLMLECLRSQALSVRTLPKVMQEWQEPTHPEFAEDGKSVWRFFNACTEAYKVLVPEALPRRTMALHGILDKQVGLTFSS